MMQLRSARYVPNWKKNTALLIWFCSTQIFKRYSTILKHVAAYFGIGEQNIMRQSGPNGKPFTLKISKLLNMKSNIKKSFIL